MPALRMKIPDQDDWKRAQEGLDEGYAFRHFFGKSLEEAFRLFENHALMYQEDLSYMPEYPFKYYLRAYIYYLGCQRSQGDSDAASCFLHLIRSQVKNRYEWLEDSWDSIERVLFRLSSDQAFFDASEKIYGDFGRKVDQILALRETEIQRRADLK